MTLRTLILATSALVLSAGVMSTDADAATRHRARHSATMAHHSAMSHSAMRTRMGRRGGTMATRGRDAESGSVDQLNAQSLAAARGGAPAAPAAQ